ncbi:nucleosome binding factor SPN SPT16 subunit [Staphylococcus auricularis]|mgnify:FL=1|uniref:YSIRK-type signal peptide-containing protein n=1 Tax=Staphylococcus auricularis TaxID=29379 RepID=UPI0012474D7B|nr:YSIRK-type signal peptide-containing protein [Staphylococcus auricularis]MBM0868597.1 YSIRK-type signal peptide-containing protein [Staphylococcus auricularis]MCG7341825.1 YSIRK-type signal peptide-containing protein [Staphylococcus auricularis]
MKKRKKRSGSRRLDFLPNRMNKYSIRKFTVGTASILIGATLFFGVNNDAQASEVDNENKETTTQGTTHSDATTEQQSPEVTQEESTENESSDVETEEIESEDNVSGSQNTEDSEESETT